MTVAERKATAFTGVADGRLWIDGREHQDFEPPKAYLLVGWRHFQPHTQEVESVDAALTQAGWAIEYNTWCPTALLDKAGCVVMAGEAFRNKAQRAVNTDDDEP